MATPIMIQGTMSNAGKSIITAGLCRIFAQDGHTVAPFKSQNMALNSFITADGGEMGRAQVVQAEACGIEPTVAMNPILLKPVTDMGSQVIVNGQARSVMTAREYFAWRHTLIPDIQRAYDQLSAHYDLIVIEGAGSPAEINLRHDDIVNMGLAHLVDAPVLLVGDIDRGGVFAQLFGTHALLDPPDRERIKGFVINKFRGDASLLTGGLDDLERRSGVPTLGVVPHLSIDIDDEDSLSGRLATSGADGTGRPDIVVIRLPRISNFTDFTALGTIDTLAVRYVDAVQQFGQPDLVIIPGTRNTIADLTWLRSSGLAEAIERYAQAGGLLFGVCGGYQMLGQTITDPLGVEGGGTTPGLGFLPIATNFRPSKHQTRTQGVIDPIAGRLAALSGAVVEGYEIHMGDSHYVGDATALITLDDGTADGCVNGNVAGTYLHGIFDSTAVRAAVTATVGGGESIITDYNRHRQHQLDLLADALRASVDIQRIYHIMGVL